MLYYIEPQDTWSLSAVITDLDGAGVPLAQPRMLKEDVFHDRDFIEAYAHVMRDCHGVWPPTVAGHNEL